MKQSFIKILLKSTLCVFISAMTTTGGYAQEPDAALLKMMPEIPTEITEPAQRAEYLILHFWDKFDFSNTDFLIKDHLFERCFVDYVDLLSLVTGETIDKSVNTLMKKAEAEKSVFSLILKLSEQYLYEPASPVCDEEKLAYFLRYALQSTILDDIEKIRPKFLLGNISKNRPGDVANDFSYTLINGETGSLHSVEAEYTILYFNDPECEDCMMLIKQLIASPIVNELTKQGKLKILMTYVNDDIEAWKKHSSDVLNSWIYSRDTEQKIIVEEIYNIKEFPTMYLLDKEKKVLLKDTTFEKLENYLNAN